MQRFCVAGIFLAVKIGYCPKQNRRCEKREDGIDGIFTTVRQFSLSKEVMKYLFII